MAIAYTYTGNGFLSGVPARHLTKEEYDSLSDAQKESVRKSGLYETARGDAAKGEPHEDITKGGAGGTKRVIAPPGNFVPPELVDRLVPHDQVMSVLAPHTVQPDAPAMPGSAVNPPEMAVAPAEGEPEAEPRSKRGSK
jgi:hypothetical protein